MADSPEWGWSDAATVIKALHWESLQIALRLRADARRQVLEADTTNIIARDGLLQRGGFAL